MAGRLIVILGDQLDVSYLASLKANKETDTLLMMEVQAESEHVASHVQRTVLFLAAMRHHAQTLREKGWKVDYISLESKANTHSFESELVRGIKRHKAREVLVIQPGEWRVVDLLESACEQAGVELIIESDPHFISSIDEFTQWAKGRKELTMEFFYREQRKKLGVLMDDQNQPEGGAWNFDKENRQSFKAAPSPPDEIVFKPDALTLEVIKTVQSTLPDLPGELDRFNWPVTRAHALVALKVFVKHRLPYFGDYQDAMWTGEDTLYHSLLSPSLNLKLLNPREVVNAAVAAYTNGLAPLNAVEGFVRQIIGWREFIRGVYWTQGPQYASRNSLGHHGQLPEMYWTARTDMNCMKDALRSVHERAYGHHIARLMITGNFALIAGIDPRAVSDWYLGMYADAVDWVTLPNTLGMALHADGGIVGTKPYAASGNYVHRMSNYCKGCAYDVKQRIGENACPFNTFYWDFLIRHRERFSKNRRMSMILKHLDNMTTQQMAEIRVSAQAKREKFGIGSIEA